MNLTLIERAEIAGPDANCVAHAREGTGPDPSYYRQVAVAAERILAGSDDPEDIRLVLQYDLVEATGSPNDEETACRAHLKAIKAWRKDMGCEAKQNAVLATRTALRSVFSMAVSLTEFLAKAKK